MKESVKLKQMIWSKIIILSLTKLYFSRNSTLSEGMGNLNREGSAYSASKKEMKHLLET